MNYRLIVLTHGDHAYDLQATLAAFAEHVHPAPVDAFLHADAPASDPWKVLRYFPWPWTVGDTFRPRGFCYSTRACWHEAVAGPHSHVVWLEHDHVIERPVDLAALAAVLDHHPMLAQMALMRNPVNAEEVAAGGLVESRPGQYEPREWFLLGEKARRLGWLEHRSYFTTNVSLMRRQFMVDNPWPSYESECEGRFGIDLVARGYSFGVWGDGRPWTRHIGTRDGQGY